MPTRNDACDSRMDKFQRHCWPMHTIPGPGGKCLCGEIEWTAQMGDTLHLYIEKKGTPLQVGCYPKMPEPNVLVRLN